MGYVLAHGRPSAHFESHPEDPRTPNHIMHLLPFPTGSIILKIILDNSIFLGLIACRNLYIKDRKGSLHLDLQRDQYVQADNPCFPQELGD